MANIYHLAMAGIAGLSMSLSLPALADDRPVLNVGGFDPVTTELTRLAGTFDGAAFVVAPSSSGFAEQAAALNAGQLDIARYGATTAFRQQANETPQWTSETAPVKVVIGFAPPPKRDIPKVVTAVRSDAGIDSPADLAGKTWAVSIGGDNTGIYLASLESAGLTEDDIVLFESSSGSGALLAAFRTGNAQIYTAASSQFIDLLESGEARILYSADDLGISWFPGFAVQAAALEDPEKEPLIRDFLVRYNEFESVWYDANPDIVRDVLINIGHLSPELADFTIRQHEGTRSVNFNEALYSGVRKAADLLAWAGHIVPIEDIEATFDDRYNALLNSVDYQY